MSTCLLRIWILLNVPLPGLPSYPPRQWHSSCGLHFSKSNLSSTKDCQNWPKTYSLVNLALSLYSAFGHILPVLSSNNILFSSHSHHTHWWTSVRLSSDYRPQEQAPKNIIRLTQFEPQGLWCQRGSLHRRRPGGKHSLHDKHTRHPSLSPACNSTTSRDSVLPTLPC